MRLPQRPEAIDLPWWRAGLAFLMLVILSAGFEIQNDQLTGFVEEALR